MTPDELSFPPLFRGESAPFGADPFAKAVASAAMGSDPGLIVHNGGGEQRAAALVLAPEAPLRDAMAMVFAVALGFSDALGALAPPEVGVHMDWPTGLRVNGAKCGRLRVAASTTDPDAEPDWLVVGFELAITLPEGVRPGDDPETTALFEEGCTDVDPFRLVESWSRHTLVWINTWLDDGMPKLHSDWRGRAYNLGDRVEFELQGVEYKGVFMGIDEYGGMLLRRGDDTTLIPLTDALEGAA